MKNSPYALSKKIYRCRELLIRLAGEHGTAHPSVLLQSRKLDKLINLMQNEIKKSCDA